MSTTPSRLLKTHNLMVCLLLVAGAPPLTLAQTCGKDMDKTFEQARSVLRAHNCKVAGRLDDCETQMGLGTALGVGAAGVLGVKASLSMRDPKFGICALTARSWFLDEAVAGTACTAPDLMRKMQLAATNKKLQEAYDILLKDHKAELEADELTLKVGSEDPKKKLNAAKAAREEAHREYQALAKGKGVNLAELPVMQKEYERKMSDVVKLYEEVTGKELVDDRQIDELTSNNGRKQFSQEAQGKIAEIRKLDNESRQLDDRVSRAQNVKVMNQHDETFQRAAQRLENLDAEVTALEKAPPKPAVAPQQTEKIKARILETKAKISNIQKSSEASVKIGEILSQQNITSLEDIDDSHRALKKLAAGNPTLSFELSTNGPAQSRAAGQSVRVSRLPGNEHFFQKLAGTFAHGGIKSVVFAVATRVGMGVANATAVGVLGENVNPIYRAVLGGNLDCRGQLDLDKYKLFKVSPETNCYPDFRIKADTLQFLNMDQEDLKSAIQEYPEICEFIDYNVRNSYPKAKATCTGSGSNIVFDRGPRVETAAGKLSFFATAQTKFPVIVKLDHNDNESVLSVPRAGRKGTASYLDVDLSKKSESGRYDELASIYGEQLPVIAEAKACCSSEGTRPSDADCLRYGITPTSRNSPNPKRGTL